MVLLTNFQTITPLIVLNKILVGLGTYFLGFQVKIKDNILNHPNSRVTIVSHNRFASKFFAHSLPLLVFAQMPILCIEFVDLFKYSSALDNPSHAFNLKVKPILSDVKFCLIAIEQQDLGV